MASNPHSQETLASLPAACLGPSASVPGVPSLGPASSLPGWNVWNVAGGGGGRQGWSAASPASGIQEGLCPAGLEVTWQDAYTDSGVREGCEARSRPASLIRPQFLHL